MFVTSFCNVCIHFNRQDEIPLHPLYACFSCPVNMCATPVLGVMNTKTVGPELSQIICFGCLNRWCWQHFLVVEANRNLRFIFKISKTPFSGYFSASALRQCSFSISAFRFASSSPLLMVICKFVTSRTNVGKWSVKT